MINIVDFRYIFWLYIFGQFNFTKLFTDIVTRSQQRCFKLAAGTVCECIASDDFVLNIIFMSFGDFLVRSEQYKQVKQFRGYLRE
jgi:hypothetical protein